VSTLRTTIRNRLEDIRRVPDLIAGLAAQHDLPPAAVFDMNVALDEVLSNIIKYAYPDQQVHEIELRLIASKDEVIAEINDDGRPFDPLSVPPPQLDQPIAERRVGGLGIHFVRNLMSDASYSRVGGRNRLILRLSLRPRRKQQGESGAHDRHRGQAQRRDED
jgi:anti-sigma regulatory factor (Ser/Thr protein kinase)